MEHFYHHILFATLAIVMSGARYATYLWAMHKGEARPHVFSWFNWGLMLAIGAATQWGLQGGPSIWVMAFGAAVCWFVTILALFMGEKNITRSDWFAFVGALLAIPVWMITKNPFMAVIVIVSIDCLTYFPTIRKSWMDPWGEPPVSYFWAGLRYFFALFAVTDPNIQNLAYLLMLMVTDWGFAVFLVLRRRVLTAERAQT